VIKKLKAVFSYLHANDGGVAIEFAIIGPVFIALVTAVFEYAAFVYVERIVERENREISRLALLCCSEFFFKL